jgi:hypothetical protein
MNELSVTIDPSQPVPDQYDLICEGCGYSLVGLMADRCPECGERFDPQALPLARVPWLFRRSLGTFNAYFRTVWMILRTPTAFAREMSRPVRICAADARSFRAATIWLTMLMAFLCGIGIITAVFTALWYQFRTWSWLSPREIIQTVWIPIACLIAIYALLWVATDLPTFIWRGLPANPKDLAPLHHYACAPLAMAPLVLLGGLVVWGILFFTGPPMEAVGFASEAVGFGILLLMLPLWWIPVRLMRGATGCSIGRQLLLGLYLPFHWALVTLGAMVLAGVLMMPIH